MPLAKTDDSWAAVSEFVIYLWLLSFLCLVKGVSVLLKGILHGCAEISYSEEVSPTIQSAKQVDVLMLLVAQLIYIVRRLTPLECERLQGYPDYWTCLPTIEHISDNDMKFWQKVILTHKQINGKKAVSPATENKMIKWYNKLETNGSRYKALGNSLAIPNALRVIRGIAKYAEMEMTHDD